MRIDPDPAGPELVMLSQYLDYQRETIMLSKTGGLTRASSWPSSIPVAAHPRWPALSPVAGGRGLDGGALRWPARSRAMWASVDWEPDPDWEFGTAA
jgi:hypothetical protein